jgi:23S rRNA (adenine2503-C2)-methyltransferase
MLQEIKSKTFANGAVYALKTLDGYQVETTDTFLPFYTKDAAHQRTNQLTSIDLGDRGERWMVGVSVMSGCPVRCKFCATGKLKKWRNLTMEEIVEQVLFVIKKNNIDPNNSKEFKINYTRMGDTFLNVDAVRGAIEVINNLYPKTHHYISTIGVKGSDFSWIKDNITLQLSLHSLNEEKRNWLIPYKNKLTIEELGKIRTKSHLKTTINMTLVDESDFDIEKLKKHFAQDSFFIKVSPVNPNEISDKNLIGDGIIKAINII